MLLATRCVAAPRYSLPLQGYFHPGRTFPIKLDAQVAAASIAFSGTIPIDLAVGANGVVPVISFEPTVLDPDGSALSPLVDSQRLVACDASLGELAATIFPKAKLIRIDPVQLAGSADAWESLDAWLSDQPPSPSIDSAALLAHGMTFAVHADAKPNTDLPWQRVGALWIARPIAPPIEALLGSAYRPTESWRMALSPAERTRLFGVTTLVSLISLASLLYGGRGRSWIIAGTISGCIVGVLVWRNQQSPVRDVGGSIYVQRPALRQNDRWTFWRSLRPRSIHVAERPLPMNAAHATALGLREEVRSDGSVRWRLRLVPGQTLATLKRGIEPMTIALDPTKDISPLAGLAGEAYASPGAGVSTVQSVLTRDWPGMLVRQLD